MTERFDTGRTQLVVAELPPKSKILNIAIVIIVSLVIILLVIFIVLFLLRRRSVAVSTAGGLNRCASDLDCNGTQICNPNTAQCVDCVRNDHCPFTAPLCRPDTNTCAICLTDNDCPTNSPFCDPTTKTCGQCRSNQDCPTGASICNLTTKQCVECISNIQCTTDQPLCNLSNNTCVQCITNTQCVAPAVCLNGNCCDLTPPVLTNTISVTSVTPGQPLVSILGTYKTSPGQPQAGQILTTEISDADNVPLRTVTGTAAVGSFRITQNDGSETPKLFAGYVYNVRVRVSIPCGLTAYSNRLSTKIPTFPKALVAEVVRTAPTPGGINIFIKPVDPTDKPEIWHPRVYFTNQAKDFSGTLDPNRAFIQDNVTWITAVNTENVRLTLIRAPWPPEAGAILPGSRWVIRISGRTGINALTISPPFFFTVS